MAMRAVLDEAGQPPNTDRAQRVERDVDWVEFRASAPEEYRHLFQRLAQRRAEETGSE
jgi:hypothetical protein